MSSRSSPPQGSGSGGGGGAFSQVSVSSNYTAADAESVWVDAGANPVTVTLPSPEQGTGVRVAAEDASFTVDVDPGGNTINGSGGTRSLAENVSEEYEADGSKWMIV